MPESGTETGRRGRDDRGEERRQISSLSRLLIMSLLYTGVKPSSFTVEVCAAYHILTQGGLLNNISVFKR